MNQVILLPAPQIKRENENKNQISILSIRNQEMRKAKVSLQT